MTVRLRRREAPEAEMPSVRAEDVSRLQGMADGCEHLEAIMGLSAGAAVHLSEVPVHPGSEARRKPARIDGGELFTTGER